MAPAQLLSIGDVLMLSQNAWKVSRTFSNNRTGTPREFAQVGTDARDLSDALKLVGESLHEDDSLLQYADEETKLAVNAVLESAQKTLSDLESFVERHQVTHKKQTSHGFSVERAWSDPVIANYTTFEWTADGGSINDLRELLQMHTDSIRLSLRALQSRSPLRLQRAKSSSNRGSINSAEEEQEILGELEMQGDDLNVLMSSLHTSDPDTSNTVLPSHAAPEAIHRPAGSLRSIGPGSSASSPATWDMLSRPARLSDGPTPRHSDTSLHPAPLRASHAREAKLSTPASDSGCKAGSSRRDVDSAYFSVGPVPSTKNGRRMDWSFETGSPPDGRKSISEHLDTGNSPCDSAYVASGSATPRRESSTLPNLLGSVRYPRDGAAAAHPAAASSSTNASWSNALPELSDSYSSQASSLLPPPALTSEHHDDVASPATPFSYFNPAQQRSSSNTVSPTPDDQRLPSRPLATSSPATPRQTPRHSLRQPSSPPATAAARPAFEKQLFRNAVILCDLRARLVEHAQTKPDEPDPRFNVEMVPSCASESRVLVIRKRENREHAGTRVATSIWTLSTADQKTRMQQKLSEVTETIPYCSYFEPEKVSLQSVDNQIALRFHAPTWGDMLLAEQRTSWINYIFASEADAFSFQSAIFGRKLLGSYRTTKTTVIHAGLKGAFAFEEQFANIEMLRIWEDDGLLLPGAEGGVMALMHVSSSFGEGWARWWINNAAHPVRVKEDGVRHVKIKGIDLTVVRPGVGASKADGFNTVPAATASSPTTAAADDPQPRSPLLHSPTLTSMSATASAPSFIAPTPLPPASVAGSRNKNPYKRVTGVRIEFKTEDERNAFVTQARAAQARALPLPDL